MKDKDYRDYRDYISPGVLHVPEGDTLLVHTGIHPFLPKVIPKAFMEERAAFIAFMVQEGDTPWEVRDGLRDQGLLIPSDLEQLFTRSPFTGYAFDEQMNEYFSTDAPPDTVNFEYKSDGSTESELSNKVIHALKDLYIVYGNNLAPRRMGASYHDQVLYSTVSYNESWNNQRKALWLRLIGMPPKSIEGKLNEKRGTVNRWLNALSGFPLAPSRKADWALGYDERSQYRAFSLKSPLTSPKHDVEDVYGHAMADAGLEYGQILEDTGSETYPEESVSPDKLVSDADLPFNTAEGYARDFRSEIQAPIGVDKAIKGVSDYLGGELTEPVYQAYLDLKGKDRKVYPKATDYGHYDAMRKQYADELGRKGLKPQEMKTAMDKWNKIHFHPADIDVEAKKSQTDRKPSKIPKLFIGMKYGERSMIKWFSPRKVQKGDKYIEQALKGANLLHRTFDTVNPAIANRERSQQAQAQKEGYIPSEEPEQPEQVIKLSPMGLKTRKRMHHHPKRSHRSERKT